MKTLLHICCAPCSYMCIQELRVEGHELTGLWYNPNIHPFTEYRSRLDTLISHAQRVDLPLMVNDCYGLREFVPMVIGELGSRCKKCYDIRLDMTARYAAENSFEAFTTTLLISPYQNHEAICEIALEKSKKYGVSFHYKDFRPYFREGQRLARESGYYMQKYCGCIFSEEERYQKKIKNSIYLVK